jgi:hypothetical protein
MKVTERKRKPVEKILTEHSGMRKVSVNMAS